MPRQANSPIRPRPVQQPAPAGCLLLWPNVQSPGSPAGTDAIKDRVSASVLFRSVIGSSLNPNDRREILLDTTAGTVEHHGHTFKVKQVPASTWWLRAWQFLYGKNTKATLCRLFWGFVFYIPVALGLGLLFAVVSPFIWVGDKFKEAKQARRRRRATMVHSGEYWAKRTKVQEQEKIAKEKWNARGAKFLDWWGVFSDRWIGRFQFLWRYVKWPVTIIFYIVLAAIAIAIIGVILWALYQFVTEVAPWTIIGIVVGGLVLAVGMLWVMSLIVKTAPVQSAGTVIGAKVDAGAMTFFGMIREGYYAVKTRTCPVIDVVEDK